MATPVLLSLDTHKISSYNDQLEQRDMLKSDVLPDITNQDWVGDGKV